MADKLALLFIIVVGGCLSVGVIGLLMPLILFMVAFGLSIMAFAVLAWFFGRILS